MQKPKSKAQLYREQAAVLDKAKRDNLYEQVIAKLDAKQAQAFRESMETYKELVDLIEADQHPICKDHYDKYLRLTKTPIEVIVTLCAGGNRQGVIAAARINGVQFML